jgi:hypothetical protein
MEHEQGAGEQPRSIEITPGSGSMTVPGEGLGMRIQGPNRDGISVSDADGTAAVDIQDGTMTRATTTGVPSNNEDGSLATGRTLARRLNQDGATWGEVYEVKARIGGGVDCEAKDTGDPSRLLKIQVTRAEGDGVFWTRLRQEALAELPTSTVDEVVARVWNAISKKRLHARPDEVLALNAIRTPWAVTRPVVDTFRQRHGEAARRLGFNEVWVVGWSEAMTERLDT